MGVLPLKLWNWKPQRSWCHLLNGRLKLNKMDKSCMCLHQNQRKITKEVKFQSDTFYQYRSTLHCKTGDSYIWKLALSLLVQSGSWNRQLKGGICSTPMMSLKGIEWSLNPPTGLPHRGLWERLICSIKKIVSSTLRTQSLDEGVLHNELCEVEWILNSRLITKDSTEPNDLKALKPKSHLLFLKTKLILPPGNSERGCLCVEVMDVLVLLMELRGYVVYIVVVEGCFIFAIKPSNTAEWNFDSLTACVTHASLPLQALVIKLLSFKNCHLQLF